MRTVDDVIRGLPSPAVPRLKAPRYAPHALEPRKTGHAVGLCVPSMERHTTDEGIQLFTGLESAGYVLQGAGLGPCFTNVAALLRDGSFPALDTVLVQDQREWEGRTAGRGFDDRERFRNVEVLRSRPDVFTGTVLKDAHRDPEYHSASAAAMGAHFWVTYYHPRIVKHLAPFVREEHLVRTYHTVDADRVPHYQAAGRYDRALLSGAVSGVYPLRTRLAQYFKAEGPTWMDYLKHPGYGRDRCHTPDYLSYLSRYKVAICTSSSLSYTLRKLVEATACGCRVITDLAADDVLPGIDGNMYRIPPDCPTEEVGRLVGELCREYDPKTQVEYAAIASVRYDFRTAGKRLAADVEALRRTYRGEE